MCHRGRPDVEVCVIGNVNADRIAICSYIGCDQKSLLSEEKAMNGRFDQLTSTLLMDLDFWVHTILFIQGVFYIV